MIGPRGRGSRINPCVLLPDMMALRLWEKCVRRSDGGELDPDRKVFWSTLVAKFEQARLIDGEVPLRLTAEEAAALHDLADAPTLEMRETRRRLAHLAERCA